MANIGLTIRDNPDLGGGLSLADTLAKGIFGDPEAAMKARLMASQVGAHQAYATKLDADTGLVRAKTTEEINAENERLRAGPLVGAASAAAVPQPVPVEASRPTGFGAYGPQPGIVSPVAQAQHDALVARERALGPILVRGNPNQVAEAVGKDYGGAIISGAASNPAIVNPDSLRLASTLYTGSAPTTSTVMTTGDYAGVDAAAREKILAERARPIEPKMFGDKPYTPGIGPDGQPVLTPTPGFQPTPKDPNVIDLPGGGKGTLSRDDKGGFTVTPIQGAGPVPKLVTVGPDTMQQNPDGSITTPKTDRPTVVANPYEDIGTEKGRGRIINEIMTQLAQPTDPLRPGPKVTPDQARAYDQAYTGTYGAKTTVENIGGVMKPVTVWPDHPNFYSPRDVYKIAGIDPPTPTAAPGPPPAPTGAPPAGGGQPAPAPAGGAAPVGTGGQVTGNVAVGGALSEPKLPPVTDAQGKDRLFVAELRNATAVLDKFGPNDVPNIVNEALVSPTGKDTGNIFQRWAEVNLPSGKDREYGSAVSLWLSTQLYKLSGAAIGEGEFARGMRGYVPRKGDTPELVAEKTQRRYDFIKAVAENAFAGNEEAKQAFYRETIDRGIQLDDIAQGKSPLAKPNAPSAPAAAGDTPPKSYIDQGGTPEGWKRVKNRGLWQ